VHALVCDLHKGRRRDKGTPFRSPSTNAFVERFSQTLQQEALDYFIIFGQQHFDYIVREYIDYDCRPHQGFGNVLLPKPR